MDRISNSDQIAQASMPEVEDEIEDELGSARGSSLDDEVEPEDFDSDDAYLENEDVGYDASISWVVVLLVVLQPISWIKLPGQLDLSWISLVVAGLALAYRPFKGIDSLTDFWRLAPWLHALYASYLLAVTISLSGSASVTDGLMHLARAYVLFLGYLFIGATLVPMGLPKLARTVRVAVPIAVGVFAVACAVSMGLKGENIFAVLVTSLQSGDATYFTTKFTRSVFSLSLSSSLAGGTEQLEWEGARNAVGASYIFLATCFACFSPAYSLGRVCSVATVMLLALGIGTLFLCRSAQVSFVLVIATAYLHYQFSGTGLMNRSLPVVLVLGVVVCSTGFLFIESSDLVQLTIDRFAAISEDARIEHYQLLWQGITERPILGQGLGAEIGDGRKGHNFILAAWFRAGIFGGLTSLLFYLALSWRWFEASFLSLRNSFRSDFISRYWMPTLLVGPLFRRMISGDDGRFVLVEWFSVAVFLVANAYLTFEDREWSEEHAEFDEYDEDGFEDEESHENYENAEAGLNS